MSLDKLKQQLYSLLILRHYKTEKKGQSSEEDVNQERRWHVDYCYYQLDKTVLVKYDPRPNLQQLSY